MKLFTNFIATLLIHQTLVVVVNGLTTGASLEHAELANFPNPFKKIRKKKLPEIQEVPVDNDSSHNGIGVAVPISQGTSNLPSADVVKIGSASSEKKKTADAASKAESFEEEITVPPSSEKKKTAAAKVIYKGSKACKDCVAKGDTYSWQTGDYYTKGNDRGNGYAYRRDSEGNELCEKRQRGKHYYVDEWQSGMHSTYAFAGSALTERSCDLYFTPGVKPFSGNLQLTQPKGRSWEMNEYSREWLRMYNGPGSPARSSYLRLYHPKTGQLKKKIPKQIL